MSKTTKKYRTIEDDAQARIEINNMTSTRAWWNLVILRRDLSLYKVGFKMTNTLRDISLYLGYDKRKKADVLLERVEKLIALEYGKFYTAENDWQVVEDDT